MKIFGRILIIMAVFLIVTGLIVTIVNASGMNAHAIDDTAQFRPQNFGNGSELRPPNLGNRPLERGERDGDASRLVLGMIKNVVVIGFLVTVIVWPKSIAKKKKRINPVITANGKS